MTVPRPAHENQFYGGGQAPLAPAARGKPRKGFPARVLRYPPCGVPPRNAPPVVALIPVRPARINA